jgi:hypothetical protein
MLVMVDVKFVHLNLITIHGWYNLSLAHQFVSIHYCVSLGLNTQLNNCGDGLVSPKQPQGNGLEIPKNTFPMKMDCFS